MQHIEKDFPNFLDGRLEEQKGKIVNNLQDEGGESKYEGFACPMILEKIKCMFVLFILIF